MPSHYPSPTTLAGAYGNNMQKHCRAHLTTLAVSQGATHAAAACTQQPCYDQTACLVCGGDFVAEVLFIAGAVGQEQELFMSLLLEG